MLAADYIAGSLVSAGLRHVFGVGGANIEDLFAAVQRQRPRLRAVLTKHEHAAGAAADAYARLTGGLGVVLATSGGGAMNVVHALAEAKASRVPVLALIGEPPIELQGRGAFQDTSGRNGAVDAAAVFRPVAVSCRRVTRAYDANPFPELCRDPKREWVGDWWPLFYAGHTLELANLKAILEHRHRLGVPLGPYLTDAPDPEDGHR